MRRKNQPQNKAADTKPTRTPPVVANRNSPQTTSSLSPSPFFAFLCFLAVQSLSSVFNIIGDCDETFNYWEPTHFLHHGKALQTWEYSPTYALRSYAYLWLHLVFGQLAQFFTSNKIHQFYFMRFSLGLITSICLTYFYSGIRIRYKPNNPINSYYDIPFFTFWFLIVSTGIFISGTAYLPSSFAMNCLMVSHGAWMRSQQPSKRRYFIAIFAVAMAVILGWPFAGLVGVPLAVYLLITEFFYFWGCTIISGLICLAFSSIIDYYYYDKVVIAAWNILKYNVFESKGGPELYGVEAWFYYLLNGFLNFNLVLLFAFLGLPVTLSNFLKGAGGSGSGTTTSSSSSGSGRSSKWENFLLQSSFPVWFLFMSTIPHKEERFLFVVYPQLCFAAATFFSYFIHIISSYQKFKRLAKLSVLLTLLFITCFSASRTASLIINYNAPIKTYTYLSEIEIPQTHFLDNPINVCVGGEWHRFPSSYFLPNNCNLTFIYDGPTSQLPQYFPSSTSEISPHFNDMNKEEPSRYIATENCHYIVGRHLETEIFERFDHTKWELILGSLFLDAPNSHRFFRILHVPFISFQKNSWSLYYILRKRTTTAN